ncbi:hypothetical protein ACRTDU_03950 [Sunxiuqinia elliptica]
MGMLDLEELQSTVSDPAPEENNFEAAGDDYLANYLEEVEIPKQEQPAPEIPPDEEFEVEEIESPSYSNEQLKTSQTTAFFVVNTLDDLLSIGIAAYALEKDSKDFKASKEEIKEISKHLSVYFAENSFNLPPWAMAAIPGAMVITKKFNMAGKLRQSNLEKKKAENEVAELKREIDRLNMEKKAANLRDEVNSLKNETKDN